MGEWRNDQRTPDVPKGYRMKFEYQLLKQGDIIRVSAYSEEPEAIGIVTDILEHGQVQIFWPMSNKTTVSGKQWAECNLELVEYENPS